MKLLIVQFSPTSITTTLFSPNSLLTALMSTHLVYEVHQKVPGLDQKANASLTYFGSPFLQNSPLWNVYSNPITFSTLQKHRASNFV
jgi:hypothetical protein